MIDFQKLAKQYKDELMDSVLPFWLEHSQDKEYGGYFSCLDRDGSVYDTDKFIWLQGREVWLFAMLYNCIGGKEEWLDCALQGGEASDPAVQYLLQYFCMYGIRSARKGHRKARICRNSEKDF